MKHAPSILALAAAAVLAGCATTLPPEQRTARIERTTNGVAHISATNLQTLAYGVAYAHAQDNVCQTAQQLLTVSGERSRYFGPTALGLLGRRMLPNAQIDLFIAAHMNDEALARASAAASADAQAMAQGYVDGYNRYLTDNAATLSPVCRGQAWLRPMTLASYRRLAELTAVQAGAAALADAIVAASPPAARSSAAEPALNLADAEAAAREAGLLDPPLGSNAWAFGKDSTGTGSGLLLGNPHFPWAGVNRFWEMHLTVPGRMDVMGAAIGHGAVVQIGFNKDVAWSHTVSTGKRFTLHELSLVEGDPTSYKIDGKPEAMSSRQIEVASLDAAGQPTRIRQTVWSTRWGPVLVAPRLGLNWTATRAYALQDANTGNARFFDTWLQMASATSVHDLNRAMRNVGLPWVNTIAADRLGNALYADASAVPDVDAAQLQRCAPSPQAAALRGPAGIIVLDGSRSDCDWKRDPSSAVPGLTPIERMPVAVRSDWVHNSNDSFFFSHPDQRFGAISPLVGDDILRRPRTRAGFIEVPELLARGPVTPAAVQAQLFSNRNTMGHVVMPDLLAACKAGAPSQEATDGCTALAAWDLRNNVESRSAHLFRLFWRSASAIPGVYRVPYDKAQPVATPSGLKMNDPAVAAKVWDALADAVKAVRGAGFALDAPLGSVQRPMITPDPIPLHGGEENEGVLNNLGNQFAPAITAKGLLIDYGTSYVQTVSFDARGPVAQAILTYGQSTDPASPHATDQLRLFSGKRWPALPFHPEDVARERIGAVLELQRP